MDAKNVSDSQLETFCLGKCCNLLGLGNRIGQGFLDKNVATGVERHARVGGMGVGPGIDRDGPGFRRLQRFGKVSKKRDAGKFLGDILARLDAAAAQADDFEAGDGVVGPGMA